MIDSPYNAILVHYCKLRARSAHLVVVAHWLEAYATLGEFSMCLSRSATGARYGALSAWAAILYLLIETPAWAQPMPLDPIALTKYVDPLPNPFTVRWRGAAGGLPMGTNEHLTKGTMPLYQLSSGRSVGQSGPTHGICSANKTRQHPSLGERTNQRGPTRIRVGSAFFTVLKRETCCDRP
jgi:hypothetical protein